MRSSRSKPRLLRCLRPEMRRPDFALALLVAVSAAVGEPVHAEERSTVLLAQAETPSSESDATFEGGDDPDASDTRPPDPHDPGVADSELDEQAGGSGVVPPPVVEVLRIRGRPMDVIETDVSESITRFDASTIEALGAQNVSDLGRITPNVEIVTGETTQANFFIRGVGLSDFNSNAASAVAIFQDGVALNAPPLQLGQLFDLEAVEVLRGPQSIGPGRNASAGAIRVVSRRPTGETTASLRASLGRYDAESGGTHKALIQDYEGTLEFPLAGEAASSRFAFRFRDADPFKTNGCGDAPPFDSRVPVPAPRGNASICGESQQAFRNLPGVADSETGIWRVSPSNVREFVSVLPAGLPGRVGDEHNWAARGQLRFQPPGSEMDWLLNAHGSRLDQQTTLGQAIGTGTLQGVGSRSFGGSTSGGVEFGYQEPDQEEEWLQRCPDLRNCTSEGEAFGRELASGRPLDTRPYRGDYNLVGQTTLDTWGTFLRGDIGIGGMTLATLSAYDAYSRSRVQDSDQTPNRLFESDSADEAWQFWQQLSLAGELDDTPLGWEVGAYFLMEEQNVEALTELAFSTANLLRNYTQDIWSWGLWAGFSWNFLDDFTLAGGVRYNWERKRFDYTCINPNPTPRSCDPAGPDRGIDSDTWQAPTGEISLTYRFAEDLSAYAKYSRGFKPGHFNAATTQPTQNPPADAEYLDSFEFGFGGSWFDGRLSARGAAFYYLYENYQIFLFVDSPTSFGPVLEVLNAKGAENYGVELDSRLEPLVGWVPGWLDGLVVNTRIGWLHSEFLDFQNTVDRRPALANQPVPVTIDFTGNSLPNSPDFAVSGTLEWTFDLGRWGALIPRYDFAWTDDVAFDASNGRGSLDALGNPNLPELAIGQPAYWLHNLRLGYRLPMGNVEIGAWVRNLEDTVYKTFAFDASEFQQVVISYVGQPRTIGLDLSIDF